MTKKISKSFIPIAPIVRWGAVALGTAAVVISIQASADGHGHSSDKALQAEDLPAVQAIPAQIKPAPMANWNPSMGFADLVEDVSPAVVHVATSGFIERRRFSRNNPNFREFQGPQGFEDFFRDFFGDRMPQDRRQAPPENDSDGDDGDAEKETRPLGIGSGFVISADGYVVTNHHVIDRADEIVVTLADGTEYDAEIQGSDPKTDLALLKLNDANDLPFLEWGNDDNSRVGDWVLAIGNPFGLGGSASTGIISARGRDINSGPYDNFIQVDAAINRGNSGGPLFNMQGEVIGINSMIFSPSGGSVGIGFAIPSSMAKGVISQLRDSGQVQRGWIGVSIATVSEELAAVFKRDNEQGALIQQVVKDSPAEKAGLEAGDIVLNFDGVPIKEMRNLPLTVAQAEIGKSYKMDVWRDGKLKTLTIKTEPFPDDQAVATDADATERPSKQEKDSILGAELSDLSDALRKRYGVDEETQGVLLVSVERGGLAAKNGLRAGDVVTRFDNKLVATPDQLAAAIKSARKSEQTSVAVLISRRGNPGFLPFKLN